MDNEKPINLGIQFPRDADVIAEDVARFRALSPEERIELIRGLLTAGAIMMARSPKAEFLRAQTLAQEEEFKRAVKEFMKRHGY